jgi:FtsZ-binding cell division protein ZapB/ethanolamine utilization microcompartment shell protein EutS
MLESSGSQNPLAFMFGATENARIRASSLGNLVLATLNGAEMNIHFRAGSDSSTDMMIESTTGNVGIGTITPADRLQVAGDIRVGTGNNGCVRDSNGTVIAGACSSDARLKRSVTAFPSVLDKLVRLQPVHFYWRAEEYADKRLGSHLSFGLLAQDVEKVLPELVDEDENGYKLIRYNKLPLLMLQAIKDLKSENDALRVKLQRQLNDQINALKAENNSLQNQNRTLDARLRVIERRTRRHLASLLTASRRRARLGSLSR